MNKWKVKLAKWLLHSDGFKFAAVKEEDGNIWIEGDIKVMRYLDTDGYFWSKETLKRKL